MTRKNDFGDLFGSKNKAPDPTGAPAGDRSNDFGNLLGKTPEQAAPTALDPAPRPRAEAGLISDDAAAAMKAKVAETRERVLDGLGKSAQVAASTAKAMRDKGASGAVALVAKARSVNPPKKGVIIGACGVLGVVILGVTYLYVSRSQTAASAHADTTPVVAKVSAPAVAPVTPAKALPEPTIAPTTAPAPVVAAVPAAVVPVVAPAPVPVAAPVVAAAPVAPVTCSFDGQLQAADGTLISGATVTLNSKGAFRPPVTTGADGHFSFTDPTNGGVYALQIQATGYRTMRVAVTACAVVHPVVLTPLAPPEAPVAATAPATVHHVAPTPVGETAAQKAAAAANAQSNEAAAAAWFKARAPGQAAPSGGN